MAGTGMRGGERASELGELVHDDVGPPLLGPRNQLDRTLGRGFDEHALYLHPHPLLSWKIRRVRVGRTGGRVCLRAARADQPGLEIPALDLGRQLGTGREDHLVARQLRLPRQRQHRVDVPVGRAAGEQDAHKNLQFSGGRAS
jgi:hypothetical protein